MKDYVLGFLFSENLENVALIRKEHPQWQKGKLNEIGGLIGIDKNGYKLDETPVQAMVREFAEETGVRLTEEDWIEYCVMGGKDWSCRCFCAWSNAIHLVTSPTDETVIIHKLEMLPNLNIIPNVPFLALMAKDKLVNPTTFTSCILKY